MRRAAFAALAAGLAAAGPAAAPGAAPPPPVVLSVSPTQLTLVGSSSGKIAVTNAGRASVRVGVSTEPYSLAASGRVQVGGTSTGSAVKWLTVAPKTLELQPGERAEVTVTSRVPRGATPGDAHALVLLVTERTGTSSVGIRTRLGVGALVRVPGQLRRQLAITGARRTGRRLLVQLANRGNVNERLGRGQVSVLLHRSGRSLGRLVAEPRQLLPRTRGYVAVRLPRSARGRIRAIVRVRPTPPRLAGPGVPRAKPVSRSFLLRLPK